MSDEETSADVHVGLTVPRTDEEAPAGEPTLAQQLQEIRMAAVADIEASRTEYENAQLRLTRTKVRLARSAATALDAGVDVAIVAEKGGVSEGTIRNWAKTLEGGA